MSGFSSVELAGEGQLDIEQTGSESLRIQTDDNLLRYILTSVVGSELEIRTEPGVNIRPTNSVQYFLTVESTITGSGRVEKL